MLFLIFILWFYHMEHPKLGIGLEKEELPGIAYILRSSPALKSLTLYIFEIEMIHWVSFTQH